MKKKRNKNPLVKKNYLLVIYHLTPTRILLDRDSKSTVKLLTLKSQATKVRARELPLLNSLPLLKLPKLCKQKMVRIWTEGPLKLIIPVPQETVVIKVVVSVVIEVVKVENPPHYLLVTLVSIPLKMAWGNFLNHMVVLRQ